MQHLPGVNAALPYMIPAGPQRVSRTLWLLCPHLLVPLPPLEPLTPLPGKDAPHLTVQSGKHAAIPTALAVPVTADGSSGDFPHVTAFTLLFATCFHVGVSPATALVHR